VSERALTKTRIRHRVHTFELRPIQWFAFFCLLSSKLNPLNVLRAFFAWRSSEATRIVTLKTLTSIASVDLSCVLDSLLSDIAELLSNNNRSLVHVALESISALINNAPISPELLDLLLKQVNER